MPALILFDQPTLLGGDDLQLPALATLAGRLIQLIFLTAPLLWKLIVVDWRHFVRPQEQQQEENNVFVCSEDESSSSLLFPLTLWFLWLVAFCAFGVYSCVLELRILSTSCKGSPTTYGVVERTMAMQHLLEHKIMYYPMTLWIVLGLGLATLLSTKHCWNLWWPAVLAGLLWISQCLEVGISTSVAYWLLRGKRRQRRRSHPESNDNDNDDDDEFPLEETEQAWERRCHVLCHCLGVSTCFVFGGQDLRQQQNNNNNNDYSSPYQQVARALTDYVHTRNVLNVVPTDLVAGLMVLQRIQRLGRLRARRAVLAEQQQEHSVEPLVQSHIEPTSMAMEDREEIPPPLSSSTTMMLSPENNLAATTAGGGYGSSSGLRSRSSSTQDFRQSSTVPVPTTTAGEPPPSWSSRHSIFLRRTSSSSISSGMPLTDVEQQQEQVIPSAAASIPVRYQRQTRRVLKPLVHDTDRQILVDGAHFSKFALAIYTWKLYLYANPIVGPCRLCTRCALCCCMRRKQHQPQPQTALGSPSSSASSTELLHDTDTLLDHSALPDSSSNVENIHGDNLCHVHQEALLLTAGLEETDIVYANFVNAYLSMPYCILLDHKSQSVVLAIRGTLSLEDLVTDTLVDPELVHADEFGFADLIQSDWPAAGQYGHAGVVACTRNVWRDLQRHQWIDRLLTGQSWNGLYRHYSLVLTGHSLGSSVATLLSFRLRHAYPNLRVYNYCPPGCAMTWELATACKAWTTSFVLDSDLVPRLSVASLEVLRDDVLHLIGRIQVPKYQVAWAFLRTTTTTTTWCKWMGTTTTTRTTPTTLDERIAHLENILSELLADEETLNVLPNRTPYMEQLNTFLRIQQERRSFRGPGRSVRLYPTGSLVHLVKTSQAVSNNYCACIALQKCITCGMTNAGSIYSAVAIENDDLSEIVVSPTMATDHFIDRICHALQGLAQDAPSVV